MTPISMALQSWQQKLAYVGGEERKLTQNCGDVLRSPSVCVTRA